MLQILVAGLPPAPVPCEALESVGLETSDVGT